MDYKLLLTVFASVFIAELGDKTQFATLLFAADNQAAKMAVFAGASLALLLATAVSVLAGSFLAQHVSAKTLHYLAGSGFIVIGLWTLAKA